MALAPNTQKNIQSLNWQNDSSVQLNNSRVPAQRNVYSLVISAGGTGLDALLETKGLINLTCCQDEDHKNLPTTHVAYLAFDTDSASLKRVSSKQTGGATLDGRAGEFVQMTAPNIATFLGQAYRNQVPSYVSSWLDFSINPNHTGEAGAGGIRQCGRLLLFQNIEKIRAAIDTSIRGMLADREVGALNIYVMSGIAGGTGSGTFIDLSYIARDVAEGIAPSKVTMYGYLFLPDVNLSHSMQEENAQYARKNGYAALKELDYLMNLHNDGGRFVQRYSDNYIIDTEKDPFNFAHLVSGTGSKGRVLSDPYRQSMRAVAQSVVSFVAEEQPESKSTVFAVKSHYDNIAHATEQHKRKFPERHNSYLALGTYSYELPIDQILLYVTCLLFRKMDAMFDCDPEQAAIDKAYSALGLQPGGLMNALTGGHASIAPQNVKWEDLFGRNAKYNLMVMCNNWVNRTTVDVEGRAQEFLRSFPEQFVRISETWFTDPTRGPFWVNRLIVINGDGRIGLEAKLSKDYTIASGQITATKTKIEQARQQLQGAAQEAQTAGAIMGNREGKTANYVALVNQYADLHARLVALIKMRDIYAQCRDVILERNNKFFDVIVDVLEGLKDVCETNADILTHTEKDAEGDHFTWQPLRIPDVSDAIKQAFDAKGDAAQTIADFSRAIYKKAYEWSDGNVDVRTFIRDYLDENLGDIANRSLEDYIMVALKGDDLQQSVITKLGPTAKATSDPLIALSQSADKGGVFQLLSVPWRCEKILNAFRTYRDSNPDIAKTMTIQPSGINSRIFAQSILSALPLSSYAPLSEYEKAYLNQNGNSGLHLYMGKTENWAELPCPVPYRSRPKQAGSYPAPIQKIEDEQRELFRRCRELPIIRCADRNSQTVYELYIAKLPDMSRFDREAMEDESGRLDAERLQDAIDRIDGWLSKGMPDRDLSDSVHNTSYTVAVCGVPAPDEEDKREEDARECFLGEYNNIRRAREELAKYETLQGKREELGKLYDQTMGIVQRARRIIYLLVSGVAKLGRNEDGGAFYSYTLGDKERVLAKIGRRMSSREIVLSDTLEALQEDKEPMKRELYSRLNEASKKAFDRMNAKLETATDKLHRIEALSKGVTERYERLRNDVMEGVADEGIDRETVAFYEKVLAQLRREKREAQDVIDGWGNGGEDDLLF